MYKQYLKSLHLVSDEAEMKFIIDQQRTCFNGIYPFKFFPPRELEYLEFAPITIFYGGNGYGKSTLLNIIAEMLRLGGMFLDGIGIEEDAKNALVCFQKAEAYLYDMVLNGGDMYRRSLAEAIDGQARARKKLTEQLPEKSWNY